MSRVRLVCPLCGAAVADGAEPAPGGACPGCGARYAGGGDDIPGAVAAALRELGAEGLDPGLVARRLFELEPGAPLAERLAITSDQREGFYRWWVFAAAGDPGPTEALRGLASP